MPVRESEARWEGTLFEGSGVIKVGTGFHGGRCSFPSRFASAHGTNPEELIGAAHAACFTMALSLILGEAKLTAEQMETRADVTLEKVGDGFSITSVHLTLNARVPGADNAKLQAVAKGQAARRCSPASRAGWISSSCSASGSGGD